jgi:iron complex outermembrane receptor protein
VPGRGRRRRFPFETFAWLFAAGAVFAVTEDLTELSLEELMNVEVTSVSKAPERRADAAAAIAVITNTDVHRSGATSLPEALRMAPGVFVGRSDTSNWAVASRGFTELNSAKLLVLIDGRSIYTPLFSGVFWDVQDVFFEDLDRIEVIRGPGASLWGANAMNGVINVVTKSARATHGTYLEGGGGTEEKGFGGVRYGAKLGEDFHYRVFARYFERDESSNPLGPDDDHWRAGHVGFRSDWDATERDSVTLQGDVYQGEAGQLSPALQVTGQPDPSPPLEVDLAGGNLLGRWRRTVGEKAVELQLYYDRTVRQDPAFDDDLDTVDLDANVQIPIGAGHELLSGVAYRAMMNRFHARIAELRPAHSTDQLVSGFLQDQFRVGGQTGVTVGTKLEYNEFSGFEVQPSARVAIELSRAHSLWGAVSRAVRVPTRLERDLFAESPGEDGSVVVLLGNRSLEAEELVSYETGYRVQPMAAVFLDLATFYNDYGNLSALELGEPFTDERGRTIVPIRSENVLSGETYGAEAVLTWIPGPRTRVTTAYSYVDVHLAPKPGAVDPAGDAVFFDHSTPQSMVDLRVLNDLPGDVSFDLIGRWIDTLGERVFGERIDSYFNADVRLAWHAPRGIELSVVGQNLLEDDHREIFFGSRIERGVYAKVAWRH